MPIPSGSTLSKVKKSIQQHLWDAVGQRLRIKIQAYMKTTQVSLKTAREFDRCGITLIHVPDSKPEAVDKRMLVDIALSLYGLARDNKEQAIAVMTADTDFGYLLNQIRSFPVVSDLLLVAFQQSSSWKVTSSLSDAVDRFILIRKKAVTEMDQPSARRTVNKRKHVEANMEYERNPRKMRKQDHQVAHQAASSTKSDVFPQHIPFGVSGSNPFHQPHSGKGVDDGNGRNVHLSQRAPQQMTAMNPMFGSGGDLPPRGVMQPV